MHKTTLGKKFLQDLQHCLSYNPETGEFHWKSSTNNRVKVGSPAGFVHPDGRLYIGFQGKSHLSYRLAWLLTHNEWPSGVIDHIDGDPLNNRISNLRDVTCFVNMQNQRKANSDNKTGLLGVYLNKKSGKFIAQIGYKGKLKYLGSFSTPEDAHAAYLVAKRKHHEGCTI